MSSSSDDGGTLHPFVVSAPASTANLGPGFDVVGVALDLRNRLVVTPGSGNMTIAGEGAGDLPTGETNLVVRALEHAAPGMHAIVDLHCENAIPLARGLGSSAAAAAIGLVAGWTLAGEVWDANRLAHELTGFEGHADNAAACAFGGIALARQLPPGDLTVLHLDPPPWLAAVVVIPDRELSTAAARAALPASYERPVAVRAAGGAALLAASLALQDRVAFAASVGQDVLHEPFRSALVPELARVRACAREQELPVLGVTLSGAGPSVVAWCDPADVDAVAASIRDHCADLRALHLPISTDGVSVRLGAPAGHP